MSAPDSKLVTPRQLSGALVAPPIQMRKLLRAHGASDDVLREAVFEGSGRGLAVTRDVRAGEALVRLPASLIVTPAKARAALGTSGLSNVEALTCFLLSERARGDASTWASYISSIPEDFTFMPAHDEYPEGLRAALPPDVQRLMVAQRGLLNSDHEACKASGVVSDPLLERGIFQWAWFAVNTRCITYNGTLSHRR